MPSHNESLNQISPMPVTTDALLLADFVSVEDGQRILDLGSGSGVIALTLASRANAEFLGIDNSMEFVEEACRNLEAERLLLKGEIEFLPGDLRNEEYMRELGMFDQVVCNPPYYRLNEGRLPPGSQRAAARHEVTCTFNEVVRAASLVLPAEGTFSFVQVPARLAEALTTVPAHGFSMAAIQPVYTRHSKDAQLILFRAIKGVNGNLRVLPAIQLRTLAGGQ